ncbi:hypothetical protein L2E82_20928 [Cichorium intybus]|uniref:Uncharacterized protein n=1 Tax=Cichorium intybus TaxID=13427 RepID=A0ACB9DU87_CICIN|nr:hypothetical protein L2E82_20928 [Cichorium intybus]
MFASIHRIERLGVTFLDFSTTPWIYRLFTPCIQNLVENLLGDFEFELQIPYLLYRNAAQEVNGNWFYNSRECEDVANLFTRILGAYSK